MTATSWFTLFLFGVLVRLAVRAFKQGDRRQMVDVPLIIVMMAATHAPDTWPGLIRYGISGVALAVLLARQVKFDLIAGADKYAKAMAIGMLVFVAAVVVVTMTPEPRPAWSRWVAVIGGVTMIATLCWPLWWIGGLLFSAHRLRRDLKHQRPPREADEKALGIDLAPLREHFKK